MRLIISIILCLLVLSVAANAFVMGSEDYRITGVISGGGGKMSSAAYNLYFAMAQPMINPDNEFSMTGGNYDLCLGIFCTGAFETPHSVYVTGYITYDTGDKVANSEAGVIVKYGKAVYQSGTTTTDEDGKFAAEVSIPEYIADRNFNIEVYAKGRVEASYECTFNQTHCVK